MADKAGAVLEKLKNLKGKRLFQVAAIHSLILGAIQFFLPFLPNLFLLNGYSDCTIACTFYMKSVALLNLSGAVFFALIGTRYSDNFKEVELGVFAAFLHKATMLFSYIFGWALLGTVSMLGLLLGGLLEALFTFLIYSEMQNDAEFFSKSLGDCKNGVMELATAVQEMIKEAQGMFAGGNKKSGAPTKKSN